MIESTRLIQLRHAHGLSQAALGTLCGAGQQSISSWEKGEYQCRSDSIIRLCKVLGVSADYLLGLSDNQRGQMDQFEMFSAAEIKAITAPAIEPEMTTTERFEAFHEANPHVLSVLSSLALNVKRRGGKIGISDIFGMARYQYLICSDGGQYTLNNSYQPSYARLIMDACPELDGFFELRKCKD